MKRNVDLSLLIALFFSVLLLSYTIWILPQNPQNGIEWFRLMPYILIILSLIVFRYFEAYERLKKDFLILIIMLFGGITIYMVSFPFFKSTQQASEEIKKQKIIVDTVIESVESNKNIDIDEIIKENNIYDRNSKNLAERTFDIIENDEKVDNIENEVIETIPVKQNKWTCNNVGCTFGMTDKIYMTSSSTRTIATIGILMNLIFLIPLGTGMSRYQYSKEKNKT